MDKCKNGHISPDRRQNGNCIPCEKERYAKSEAKRKQTREASRQRYADPVRKAKHQTYMKDYAKKNREHLNTQARKRDAEGAGLRRRLQRLGLSYDLIPHIENHSGKCDICQGDPTDRWNTLHIDHCHETGEFRGMLCGKCNKGLGLFNDHVETLQKAQEYLIQARKLVPNEVYHG